MGFKLTCCHLVLYAFPRGATSMTSFLLLMLVQSFIPDPESAAALSAETSELARSLIRLI
jgi:hypothetical protein